MAANRSCRDIGDEAALRIEHALNEFRGISGEVKAPGLDEQRPVQILLNQRVHTKLKIAAAGAKVFMKDHAALMLIQSLNMFEFVGNSENAIPKTPKLGVVENN